MPQIRRRKFRVGRRQLTNRISYFFNESSVEETRSLDTSFADHLYDSSDILTVTDELDGEIEIFPTDSFVLDCDQEESHLDNDDGYRTGVLKYFSLFT